MQRGRNRRNQVVWAALTIQSAALLVQHPQDRPAVASSGVLSARKARDAGGRIPARSARAAVQVGVEMQAGCMRLGTLASGSATSCRHERWLHQQHGPIVKGYLHLHSARGLKAAGRPRVNKPRPDGQEATAGRSGRGRQVAHKQWQTAVPGSILGRSVKRT